METNRKFNNLEIDDLIDAAVNNAVSRRHQGVEDEPLLDVSDEEANKVAGGALPKPIITAGLICYPPTTIGIIATEPTVYYA